MAYPIITVEGFSFSYRESTKKALDQLSFSVDEFECCGIIGPAEAGKSTLCYAISSVLPHYFSGGKAEGRVSTAGLDALSTQLDLMMKKVGLLLQNSGVFLSGIKPTVREEIAFSMENLGISRSEIVDRIQSVMEELGIEHLAERDPSSLSGGETQRVALACVLALDPPILILDEPTSSLDQEGVRDLRLILNKLKGKKTILLVEQRMELLPGLVDSLLVLRKGKKVYRGHAERFFSSVESFEEDIGAPIWTQVCHQIATRRSRVTGTLPFTYRQALKALGTTRWT
ncbi:MAG: ABC transporter ATP-binding protein [Bacteroidota bacterium]